MIRTARALVLFVGVAFCLFATSQLATAGVVHAVIVADTNDRALGEGVKADARMMREILEGGIGPVLVRRDHQPVAAPLDEGTQPELAGDAAEQLARLEVDLLGRRRALAAVVALDHGNLVSRVFRGIPVHRIVVENTEDRGHRAGLL